MFSYQPPVNVLALCFMLPASYVLSPRWFHKASSSKIGCLILTRNFQVNVLMIRITNLPILLMISWYERYAKKAGTGSFYDTFVHAAEKLFDSLPRPLKRVCTSKLSLSLLREVYLIGFKPFLKGWRGQVLISMSFVSIFPQEQHPNHTQ